MHKRLVATAALAAMAVGLAYAQAPGRTRRLAQGQRAQTNAEQMQQRHVQRLATLLDLTEAQKQQTAAIFENARQQASAVAPQVRTAETSLRDAVKANNVAQIDSLAAEIGRLHGQMRAIRAKSDAEFYALLTPEQRQKYDELRPGPMMRMPGPGRPGPGPMRGGPPEL